MAKSKKKSKPSKTLTSRKRGMKRLLDPMSTGFILSTMLNDKSLHNLSMTSKKNIGASTARELIKRKKLYLQRKELENKLNTIEIRNRIDSISGGEYRYELSEYFYEWKSEKNMNIDNNVDMENDENFDEIQREFMMSFFYPRSRYSVKYVILCPSLSDRELYTVNVENVKTILDKCLDDPNSEYYELSKNHYSLNGGFYSINKTDIKTKIKV